MVTITFNELRKLKDSLPSGSMKRISEKLNIDVETVRNYFGGTNFDQGESTGIHIEQGPNGGIVQLDNEEILNAAYEILKETKQPL
jgi:hypothetical protein